MNPQALPNVQTPDRQINQIQAYLQKALKPLLTNPLVNGQLLQEIALVSGSNQINHKLGRALQGWFFVRQRAAGTAYDTQDDNQNPTLTLLLTASADMTVDLYVF